MVRPTSKALANGGFVLRSSRSFNFAQRQLRVGSSHAQMRINAQRVTSMQLQACGNARREGISRHNRPTMGRHSSQIAAVHTMRKPSISARPSV